MESLLGSSSESFCCRLGCQLPTFCLSVTAFAYHENLSFLAYKGCCPAERRISLSRNHFDQRFGLSSVSSHCFWTLKDQIVQVRKHSQILAIQTEGPARSVVPQQPQWCMSCHLAPWVWLVQTFALWCWPQTSSVWSAWVNKLGVFFFSRTCSACISLSRRNRV